jgi:NAD(P)-dependent dehydrogenase (short-subunit alcohol dehydrogenase family)
MGAEAVQIRESSMSKPVQKQPGREYRMDPQPEVIRESYRGSGKLAGRSTIITGGDSGIGRAVAVHFAREGASCAIAYLEEERDAEATRELVEEEGGDCLLLKGDVGDEDFCEEIVRATRERFGGVDVLVNNAAEQHVASKLEDITARQLERTFRTNVFGYFLMARAALPHMKAGASIINTTSVTAYRGHPGLLDYSATKGAVVAFTRSLAMSVADRGIRVNGVAPGPIWTPLIPATFSPKKVEKFGKHTPMARPGQPSEVAPCFVFLAAEDSSYLTGQVIHPNGGDFIST